MTQASYRTPASHPRPLRVCVCTWAYVAGFSAVLRCGARSLDLVNLHMFHDESNMVAMQEVSRVFAAKTFAPGMHGQCP